MNVAVSSFSPYQKQNVSIRVYGIKLNTNNDALFTILFHLRHRPAVSDLTANVKPTIALSQASNPFSIKARDSHFHSRPSQSEPR
ncbi:hypothetical protein HID58_013558 [Brassica napus]|uniref:Uncharacterized protein n=1 Tax=Brassica napus TaxID=3708 RepID=A0ABQ8E704_BRANA|nr:hypothetical protein HID58_013558 [Brassica napus]